MFAITSVIVPPFKASTPPPLLLCSAQFCENPLSVLHVTHAVAVFHLFEPLSSLDLICYTSQTCQNIR